MKNKLSLFLLSLIAICFFTACEDEQDPYGSPYQLSILGLETVKPESTGTYTIGDFKNPESYTWTVQGPAEIVGSATGGTVSVKFGEVGDVVLSVSNGVDSGKIMIEVAKTKASVTGKLTDTGVLRNGESDTVFFEFATPVEGTPTFSINQDDSTGFNRGNPFVSGELGEVVRIDENSFYTIYTAGPGNGTAEVKIEDIVSTATYGSVKIDSAYVPLYRVDNIAPVAALSYTETVVNGGTKVTVTATFSEPVMPADAEQEAMFINLEGAVSKRDTLKATANPRVYTYSYTASDDANGQVNVELENVADMAGNMLAAVNNSSELVIDNTAPGITGAAVDAGSYAAITLSLTSIEPAPGAVSGMYLILNGGADAPATPDEFMEASGVASGTVKLGGSNVAKTVAESLAAGSYTIYYLAMDAAGNYSTIESSSLNMN